MKVRWDVYPSEPPPPMNVPTPHGFGDTPAGALKDLRQMIELQRGYAARPVSYYDELLARFPIAD